MKEFFRNNNIKYYSNVDVNDEDSFKIKFSLHDASLLSIDNEDFSNIQSRIKIEFDNIAIDELISVSNSKRNINNNDILQPRQYTIKIVNFSTETPYFL